MTVAHLYNPETDAAMDNLLREFFRPVSTSCTSRTVASISRDEALHKFWRAERDAGADNLTATERMGAFARHLDQYEDDLAVIRKVMERK
jgi:hypothetical protein